MVFCARNVILFIHISFTLNHRHIDGYFIPTSAQTAESVAPPNRFRAQSNHPFWTIHIMCTWTASRPATQPTSGRKTRRACEHTLNDIVPPLIPITYWLPALLSACEASVVLCSMPRVTSSNNDNDGGGGVWRRIVVISVVVVVVDVDVVVCVRFASSTTCRLAMSWSSTNMPYVCLCAVLCCMFAVRIYSMVV